MRPRLFLIVLPLLLAACASGSNELTLRSFNGQQSVTLQVEVADEPKEQEQGLMNRRGLQENTGMLFVFEDAALREFWMKNTLIPLEIFFFDEQGEFVSFATMEPCEADPCPLYRSAGAAMYALEVSPGFKEQHGIGLGWRMDLK